MYVNVVEETSDVGGHGIDRVGGTVVRLVAVAVAAAVKTEETKAGSGQGLLPAWARPVTAGMGREAMDDDERRTPIGSVHLVMQSHAITVEIHARKVRLVHRYGWTACGA